MSAAQRQQLRRMERRRRRGGHGRGPRPVQAVARRVHAAGDAARRAASGAVRGDRPLAVALLAALVLSVLMLSGPAQRYLDSRARVDALAVKAEALEDENGRLQRRVEDLEDPTSIELLAREQQGFIRPGEVPYTLVPPEVDRPRITAPRDQQEAPTPTWYVRLWDTIHGWLGSAS